MPQSAHREAPNLQTVDNVWSRMRVEAATDAAQEPILASFLSATILNHRDFKSALSYRLAQKLSDSEMNAMQWREVATDAFEDSPGIVTAALADIQAYVDRDPATKSTAQPFLHFKGYQAIQSYRIGHWLWKQGREALALYLQSRMSELYQVDIHPASKLGRGLFFDHATAIVIGETASVGDNCSLLHEVTLGGTGKEKHERHPKVGKGVLIGAGAKILGNIEVGDGAKIASGSVVLEPVKAFCTVAGVPAQPVGECAEAAGEAMDHSLTKDD
ncbi:serine O-acetyltransferase [Parvularcula sp. ZS-1/3]|uniref:Serine acetyltransferase n=1 Tax=Parvularcula mediterranea TaxID=2732508 RepID=A0A7Y3W6K7_9PROT|nr:serine O-acetyltransferase [Parvularcula mediterranea]NNU17452.1 serine O-acetyltransferase [Parvularcula mediterranea]